MLYSYLKLIHVLAVILFLGNIITGVFWMMFAVKTKDVKIISHTMRGIIRADLIFTIPGVILLTAAGVYAAVHAHIPLLRTGWILWSIIMFSISGAAFSVLGPLQKKIYQYTLSEDFDWKEFNRLNTRWSIIGTVATITPLVALAMMVLKIPS
jgi:uncharacterized membrane protein